MGVSPASAPASAPAGPRAPVAVVDLGSNSARVVIFDRPLPGVIEPIAAKRLDLRLATEMDERSRLSERGVAGTIEAITEFAAFARELGARSLHVVATAAIRGARNRGELLARAHARLGIAIEALDGAEEAELAAAGALHGLPIRSGVIVDIGGGSTEAARVVAGAIVGAWSFPLGALGASAAWLRDDPPTRKQIKAMRRGIAEALARSAPSRLDAGERLIATGGSARALARLVQRRTAHPLPGFHGFALSREALERERAALATHSAAGRCAIDGVRAGRADSIVGGAVILEELMRRLGAERLTVAAGGVREGVALRAFGETAPRPRLVRAATIEALLRRAGVWNADAMEARASVVEGLVPEVIDDPFSEALEAARFAAMVRAIGEARGRTGAGARAAAALLDGNLAGFDHEALARIAAILHYSDGDKGAARPFLSLLARGEKPVLRRCGALLA